MRILFLNPVGTLGGAERSLLELIGILSEERPDWKVSLITGGEGPLVQAALDQGAAVDVLGFPDGISSMGDFGISGAIGLWHLGVMGLSLPARLLDLWAYIRTLRRSIDQFRPDLIHSNGFKYHVLIGLLGKVKSKTIWHARDYVSSRKLVGKILKKICKMPDIVVSNSHSVARDWDSFIPSVTKTVLHNSVSIPALDNVADGTEDLYGPNPTNALRIGLVGSYAKWKGHKVFLEAIRILALIFPQSIAQFFVVGSPLYSTGGSQWTLTELKKMAEILGISDRVVFIPHQAEVDPVYRGLDLIIHASTKPEPFGRTIIEGMAYGKAVIAALAGGVGEIIDDRKDSLAFRPGDPFDLAEKIGNVLREHDLRVSLGMYGRQKALDYFSRKVLKGKVVSLYENLVGEAR